MSPRFENVSCSQCGREFGPGDHGFSHCDSHPGPARDRLIAAAPDMLAALQNIENDGKQVPDHAWALIQAAIAKATGDESDCPGHIASDADPKVCGHCGTHIDSLRPEGGAA